LYVSECFKSPVLGLLLTVRLRATSCCFSCCAEPPLDPNELIGTAQSALGRRFAAGLMVYVYPAYFSRLMAIVEHPRAQNRPVRATSAWNDLYTLRSCLIGQFARAFA